MKIKTDFDAYDRKARIISRMLNSFFFLVNSGIAAIFIFLSLRILTSDFGRTDSERGYQWPLDMKILSAIYILVAVVLLSAQVSVLSRVRKAGWVLVTCLGIFLAAYSVEVFMGFRVHGLRAFLSYEFIYFIIFLAWITLNYFFWLKNSGRVGPA
jgi:hypothetical protein